MSSTATDKTLRADVAAVVQRQIIASLPAATWADYQRAKAAISAVCGNDAAAPLIDHEQYDMAVKDYLKAMVLIYLTHQRSE